MRPRLWPASHRGAERAAPGGDHRQAGVQQVHRLHGLQAHYGACCKRVGLPACPASKAPGHAQRAQHALSALDRHGQARGTSACQHPPAAQRRCQKCPWPRGRRWAPPAACSSARRPARTSPQAAGGAPPHAAAPAACAPARAWAAWCAPAAAVGPTKDRAEWKGARGQATGHWRR